MLQLLGAGPPDRRPDGVVHRNGRLPGLDTQPLARHAVRQHAGRQHRAPDQGRRHPRDLGAAPRSRRSTSRSSRRSPTASSRCTRVAAACPSRRPSTSAPARSCRTSRSRRSPEATCASARRSPPTSSSTASAGRPARPASAACSRPACSTPATTPGRSARRRAARTLELRVAGRGGVPNDAAAALLTITADSITGGGFVTAWPCDEAMPTASVVNLWAGTVRSNLALVKLSATDGEVCLRPTLYNGSSITLIADAVGWTPGGPSRGPVPPPPIPPTPVPPVPPPGRPGTSRRCRSAPRCRARPSARPVCAARLRSVPSQRRRTTTTAAARRQHPHRLGRFHRVDGQLRGHHRPDPPMGGLQVGDRRRHRPRPDRQGVVLVRWTPSATTASRSGLGQVRDTATSAAFEDDNAKHVVGVQRRLHVLQVAELLRGHETWLNAVRARPARTRPATCGDASGCGSGPLVLQQPPSYIAGACTST